MSVSSESSYSDLVISEWSDDDSTTRSFRMDERQIELRDLPAGAYLVHATNCLGVWGAGVAAAIRDVFPGAYARYLEHCSSFTPRAEDGGYASRDLAGRCLVIPPQPGDVAGVSVVCLFTSYGYGVKSASSPGRDRRPFIKEQTGRALREFREQITGASAGGRGHNEDGSEGGEGDAGNDEQEQEQETLQIFSPRFNSGFFRVAWGQTVKVETVFEDCHAMWTVLMPPEST